MEVINLNKSQLFVVTRFMSLIGHSFNEPNLVHKHQGIPQRTIFFEVETNGSHFNATLVMLITKRPSEIQLHRMKTYSISIIF